MANFPLNTENSRHITHGVACAGNLPKMKDLVHQNIISMEELRNSASDFSFAMGLSGNIEFMEWANRKHVLDANTAMSAAAMYGHVEAMDWLMQHAPDCVNNQDGSLEGILSQAINNRKSDVVRFLAEKKEFVLPVYLLLAVASLGDAELFKYLVDEKHYPLTEDILEEVIDNGHAEILEWLIDEKGYCVEDPELSEQVARCGHPNIYEFMLNRGIRYDVYVACDCKCLKFLEMHQLPFNPAQVIGNAIFADDMKLLKHVKHLVPEKDFRDHVSPFQKWEKGANYNVMKWLKKLEYF